MRSWEKEFTDMGAFWFHDGHPERPYVRLTTDTEDGRARISNGYFNGSILQMHAKLFGAACDILAQAAIPRIRGTDGLVPYVVAAEKGGIAMSVRIAEALGFRSAYAEKQPDGSLSFERFELERDQGALKPLFLAAEDTITSGGTVDKLLWAARKKNAEGVMFNFVLAFCNRSGKNRIPIGRTELEVIALVNRPMLTWVEGENPFTKDMNGGAELVPPVKAKTHWHELTRPYS